MNAPIAEDQRKLVTTLVGEVLAEWMRGAPWEQTFGREDYLSSLTEIENRLQSDPNSLPAKLAWFACQARANHIPVSALCSSLEDFSKKLTDKSELSAPAFATLADIGIRLLQRGQQRLAVSLLEDAAGFLNTSDKVPPNTSRNFMQLLVQALRDEKARAEVRRESKEYIQALKTKLEKFEKEAGKFQNQNADRNHVHKAQAPGVLNAKAILQQSWEESQREKSPNVVTQNEVMGRSANFKNLLIVGSSCLLVVGVLFAMWTVWQRETDSPHLAEIETKTPVSLALTLPDPGRANSPAPGLEKTSLNLDKLSERLKKIDLSISDPKSEPGTAATSSPEPAAVKPIERTPVATKPEEQLPAAPEGTVPAGINETVDLGTAGRTKAVDGMATNSLATNSAGLSVGPDGRVFGPPAPANNEMRDPGTGKAVRSYEVEQFNRPLLYKTITRTRVFSAPSMLAVSITTLDPESTIQVVSKMGLWLELKSLAGRRGYIYAQDAQLIGEDRKRAGR